MRYALAALPGMSPPPPSHVAPPLLDHTTYMSYSHEESDWTVPAVDSAAHVTGFELALTVKPKYGFPCRSSVKATNGVDVSCPMPASKACCGVQVRPPSSEYEIQTVWNASAIVTLQPVAFWGRSAAIQPTMIRPACGLPGGTIPTPAGTVLQS